MAKLSQLVPVVAQALGVPEPTVALYARTLRDAGMISTGGRGPGGAEMTNADAANLLIAVVGSDAIKNAPDTVKKFRRIKLWYGDGEATFDYREDAEGTVTGTRRSLTPAPLAFLEDARGMKLGDAVERLVQIARTGELRRLFEERAARYVSPDNADRHDEVVSRLISFGQVFLTAELSRPICNAKVIFGETDEARYDQDSRTHRPLLTAWFTPGWTPTNVNAPARVSIGNPHGDHRITSAFSHKTLFAVGALMNADEEIG